MISATRLFLTSVLAGVIVDAFHQPFARRFHTVISPSFLSATKRDEFGHVDYARSDSKVEGDKDGLNVGNTNNSNAQSIARRQLLFTMLSSAAMTSLSPPTPTFAEDDKVSELPNQENESVANAFKSYPKGKLIVPPMDTRKYETFTLENGLRVILCSDPSSNSAAAAMDVHVGAASDPDKIPGLAHFNEHMLFLGTKKYPEEDSFESFLSSNGGSSNAFTDTEDTVYYFEMAADEDSKLARGLDQFGSFFSCPLFTESATGRELNAIESENAKNLQSDVFRLYQLEKTRANTDHPYSKFYTGNKQTLLEGTKRFKLDLRTELIKFWSTYYSANQMSLALVGPQDLTTLKAMVVNAFKDIPNNPDRFDTKPEEAWAGKIPPFAPNTSIIPAQKHILKVVPVADLRQVTLTWPIMLENVQDKERQYLEKPAFYLGHLLGHEGPNSLLSYLKKKGYANGLGAATDAEVSDFYTFEVTVQLTNKGLDNINEVIESVYSYLQMLREKPVPLYIFEEVLQLSELEWRFATKGQPGPYVQSLVKAMQQYPESLYIAGPRRLALKESDNTVLDSNKPRSKFSSSAQLLDTVASTSALVSKLTVDNALITIVSKTFEDKSNQMEKWYGTKYSISPVSSSFLSQWTNCKRASDLGVDYPRKNMFIPSEEGLRVKKPISTKDSVSMTMEERLTPVAPPTLIRDDGPDGKWTVYFKQDDRFGQPKAYVIFELLTKDVYASPEKAALASLYQVSANDKLVEFAYDAGLAGLTYDIQVLPRGVRLTFGGYNDKLKDFAAYVSRKLSRDVTSLLPEDDNDFERYRDQIERALDSFDFQQPYAHAIYNGNLVLQPRNFQYTNNDLRKAIKAVSLADLTDYVKVLWSAGKAEALIQGNLNKAEALQFVDLLDSTISFKSISSDDVPSNLKPLPIPLTLKNEEPLHIVSAEPNSSNGNAATQVQFQCLDPSIQAHVIVDVIGVILSERFYEDLRTKQQLGYIVSCGVKVLSESRNLSFVVQSSTSPAEKLTSEIFKFVLNARQKFLEPITQKEINSIAKGIILKKTQPDKKLATEATRNWNEIATGRLQFDRREQEARALLNLKKDDILSYWDSYILGLNDGRGLLVSEVIPKQGSASSKLPPKTFASKSSISNKLLGVDDIPSYREAREKLI